jgi:cell division protein FtsB
VLQNIKNYFTPAKIKQLTDVRNIGLYLFAFLIIAITWSGVKTVQSNYELQKKISTIKQQNAVAALQNANKTLENQYLGTDQYLELAARQSFGLAAPGEKVLIVPKATALKYIDPSIFKDSQVSAKSSIDHRSKFVKNTQAWRDFLLGRKLFSD